MKIGNLKRLKMQSEVELKINKVINLILNEVQYNIA